MADTLPRGDESPQQLPLPPTLGVVGTCIVCFAALLANVSQQSLQSLAFTLWVGGLLVQVVAFGMAIADRMSRH